MRLFSATILTMLLSLSFSVSFAGPDWEWNRIQLKVAAGVTIEEINADYGTTTSDELDPLYLIDVEIGDYLEIINQMETDPRIEWAEPSYRDETPETTRQMVVVVVGDTVEGYQDQNVYSRIKLGQIHPYLQGSGITVAIIDTGIDADHEALEGTVWFEGPDYIDNDSNPDDSANGIDDDGDGETDEGAGHGTMVAGIVHLAAPGATLLPIRALDDEGRGISFDIAKGIRYAVAHGADIINMSFGLLSHCETIAHELDAAEVAGVIMVAAAGNDGTENPPYFPAIAPSVLSIAALDSSDVKASFSNFHADVGTAAPGVGILAPFYDGQYAIGAGTSFAAPFISGQAALILEGSPDLDKRSVEVAVRNGVVEIYMNAGNFPYLGKLGTGRMDGEATWLLLQSAASVGDGDQNGGAPSSLNGPVTVVPNPAHSGETMSILWRRPELEVSTATIIGAQGRRIANLSADGGVMRWNGRDDRGRLVPDGVYFLQLPGVPVGHVTRLIRVD